MCPHVFYLGFCFCHFTPNSYGNMKLISRGQADTHQVTVALQMSRLPDWIQKTVDKISVFLRRRRHPRASKYISIPAVVTEHTCCVFMQVPLQFWCFSSWHFRCPAFLPSNTQTAIHFFSPQDVSDTDGIMMLTEGVALTFWLISVFPGRDLDFLIRSKSSGETRC